MRNLLILVFIAFLFACTPTVKEEAYKIAGKIDGLTSGKILLQKRDKFKTFDPRAVFSEQYGALQEGR